MDFKILVIVVTSGATCTSVARGSYCVSGSVGDNLSHHYRYHNSHRLSYVYTDERHDCNNVTSHYHNVQHDYTSINLNHYRH
ncbi:hypothetical protein BX600DRAFT_517527 [Xylariales sp. PMI_506]|nr:hypothetical protein BX600DRAFT_517527 [Xylariales sp. PMI_506]